ncbi:MAG TPA: hypothetical protein PKZ77_02120, partial [Pseudomonadales bacterium]|nr:hypothetical protein [Pseudomonadales bacterium]
SERARAVERAEQAGGGANRAGATSAGRGTGHDTGGEDSPGYGSTRTAREAAAGAAASEDAGDGSVSSGGAIGRGGSGAGPQATAPVPPDIPDGNADDVVARQIREAAMKEKDPELREKLWDEYRKYTGLAKRKDR